MLKISKNQENKIMLDVISVLPIEVLTYLMSYLEYKDYLNLRLLSKNHKNKIDEIAKNSVSDLIVYLKAINKVPFNRLRFS